MAKKFILLCDAAGGFYEALMTGLDFRFAIKELGLTVGKAAEFLGVNRNTAQNWALGKTRVPSHVAILLRLMIEGELDPLELKSWNDQHEQIKNPH